MELGHILNWELKAGSHEFPGPSGGTCVNEAAIVAAGFEYRSVMNMHDLPECFSKVIGGLAILANDMLPDGERKMLMPLVTRLAGSADSDRIEKIRLDHIFLRLDAEVFSVILRHSAPGYNSEALERTVEEIRAGLKDLDDADHHVVALRYAITAAYDVMRIRGPMMFVRAARAEEIMVDFRPGILPGECFYEQLDHYTVAQRLAHALLEAIEIGRQAPAADTAAVAERMEAAKASAKARVGEVA